MNLNWYENVKIDVHENGVLIDTTQFKNLVMNSGKNFLADSLRDSAQTNNIVYLGWGTDNTAVAATQTALIAEVGRKQITAASSGGTGVCVTTCYLAPTEANASIKELAWFCGSANTLPNTGTMISRILYSRVKVATESITVTRTDTIS